MLPASTSGRVWTASETSWTLVKASVRYWMTVAPIVRGELARWRRRAEAITDPKLRELALQKLEDEHFNARAGAMLATLAPRSQRGDAVEAIVALQILFDLLDGLTEQPLVDPIGEGEQLFLAFTHAVSGRSLSPGTQDDYLDELSAAGARAVQRLPAYAAILEVAAASASRAAQAQIRMHAAPRLGIEQLRVWAAAQTAGTRLRWREKLVGSASSVLAIHALIVAAAEARTTPARAAQIDEAYLSVCAVLTLLDGIVDRERDQGSGALGYIGLYEDREALARALAETARDAGEQTRALEQGAEHTMIFMGVVAFYASAPGARSDFALDLVPPLLQALAPSVSPALALMRTWRLGRRIRQTAISSGSSEAP
jgi:tetraprenyl-beta-curcumene synthase